MENPPGSDLCYTYKFDRGENSISRYFIYSVEFNFIEREYDNNYLNAVFTDKPLPKLMARYNDAKTVDSTLLDTLLNQLLNDTNAKALITISHVGQTNQSMEYARRLVRYLVIEKRLEPARLGFFIQDAPRDRTEVWIVPEGAPSPLPSDKHIIRTEELLKKLT
jgi:hypothetical protein